MSSYRCPLCGANHKDAVERCRLCGQSLDPSAVATAPRAVAQPMRTPRGIKGVMLIGIVVIVALVAAGIVFGLLSDDRQIRQATDLVSGPADGWTTQVETEGRFQAELPGTRTRVATTYAGLPGGAMTAWQAPVGDDTEVLVGWATVAPPGLQDGRLSDGLAIDFLKTQVVDPWAAAAGLQRDATVTVKEARLGGLPAVEIHTTRDALAVQGKPAFAHATLALRGDTLYVVQVLSIYKEQSQLGRMVGSFAPTT